MEKGYSYLLFRKWARKRLVVDNCSNSHERSAAAAAIQNVLAISSTSSSQIYGEIGGCISSATYSPKQASIVATGNERQYRTTSSADGHFELHVPAGTYEVQIQSADATVPLPH